MRRDELRHYGAELSGHQLSPIRPSQFRWPKVSMITNELDGAFHKVVALSGTGRGESS